MHFIFPWRNSPYWARAASLSRIQDHIQTHHKDSSGRATSPKQRPLPDSTQHSQETNIHALGGIWTRKPSNRATADPRGHRDRHSAFIVEQI